MKIFATTIDDCLTKAKILGLYLITAIGFKAAAASVTLISTTQQDPWTIQTVASDSAAGSPAGNQTISVNLAVKFQTIDGFGGCFNELGWQALLTLSADKRDAVMHALFDSKTGCGFEFGRMPIGASDFAKSWYSLDDTPDDYALAHFNIERDEQCLIPYSKAGLAVNPKLKIWGSAWSPPAWMK